MACPRAAKPFDEAGDRSDSENARQRHENHHVPMLMLADVLKRIVAGIAGPDGEALQLQIGVESGPVAGVVIGAHRRFYCLYGDTVNVASRMCSLAQLGAVHAAGGFAQAVRRSPVATSAGVVHVRSRGTVLVKGRGLMETFDAWIEPAEPWAGLISSQEAAEEGRGRLLGVTPRRQAVTAARRSRCGEGAAPSPASGRTAPAIACADSGRLAPPDARFHIGAWAAFSDPATEAAFLSDHAHDHGRRLAVGLLLHALVLVCQRALLAADQPPWAEPRGPAAAWQAALRILDVHMALSLAACATLAVVVAHRQSAAEWHRLALAAIKAGQLLSSLLAVRELPAHAGAIVFFPAGHICLAGCLLIFPLRAFLPLIAAALVSVAFCPLLAGGELDPAAWGKLAIYAAGSAVLCRVWDERERTQWRGHQVTHRLPCPPSNPPLLLRISHARIYVTSSNITRGVEIMLHSSPSPPLPCSRYSTTHPSRTNGISLLRTCPKTIPISGLISLLTLLRGCPTPAQ